MIVIALIILLALAAALVIGLGKLVIFLANTAIVFSRLAMAAFVALPMAASTSLVEHGFLNFLLWMGISFGVLFILSMFPRVNCALKYMCTALISYLAVEMVVLLFANFFCSLFGMEAYQPNFWIEIGIKVLCGLLSFGALGNELGTAIIGSGIRSDNFLVVNFQRILASLVYAVVLTFLVTVSMNNLWQFSALTTTLIFAGSAVAAFGIDLGLTAAGVWE